MTRLLLVLLLAAPAAAQTLRVHDAERARLAREAADAFRASQSEIFDAMLANVDAADRRDLDLLRRRNQARLETTLTNLPSWTWRRFAEEVLRGAPSLPMLSSPASIEGADTGAPLREAVAAARESDDPRLPMLELAAELAEVEAARTREIARTAKWHNDHAEILRSRASAVQADLHALTAFAASQPQEQTIAATVRALAVAARMEPERESALRTALMQLARYAALIGYESLFASQADLLAESERQRAAIRMSEINRREDAILLRHGLDGLTAYHEGGLKPADVANILRAAQTIALAILAGK